MALVVILIVFCSSELASAPVPNLSLVLWDIDLTLVDVGSISQEIYAQAFQQLTGQRLQAMPGMPGRTENAILLDVLALHELPPTQLDPYYVALGDAAKVLQDRIRNEGKQLPGSQAALTALVQDDIVQSVVTGNLRSIAEIKLATFDLDTSIDFEVGGYGSDDTDRLRLVQLALERAARLVVGCQYVLDSEPEFGFNEPRMCALVVKAPVGHDAHVVRILEHGTEAAADPLTRQQRQRSGTNDDWDLALVRELPGNDERPGSGEEPGLVLVGGLKERTLAPPTGFEPVPPP